MKNIVIGTAGHIDHGKTSLVKVLTGVNTDTLIEEQKRGITVNLGFTSLKVDDDLTVGIVDVPGHEKLIKNMLAGVCGIDLVLLVIAADDGIMPQTLEHYEIIKFLKLSNVLTVITKTDLVEKKRIENVKTDIKNKLGLSNFVEFSINDNTSKERIISKIKELCNFENDANEAEMFRLPIDRVFNVKGQGVVVTGSSMSGNVNIGDELVLVPSEQKVKIKKIQVFGENVNTATKHTRVALNLGGVKKEDIKRGQILATPNTLFSSNIIDVKIEVSKDLNKPIRHLEEVKFYYLAKELKARIKLFNKKDITSGDTVYGQLLLEEPLFTHEKDFGILRRVNPPITIAGVQVVKYKGDYANRKDISYEKSLEFYAKGDLLDKVKLYIEQNPMCKFHDLKQALTIMHLEDSALEKLLNKDVYITFANRVMTVACFTELQNKVIDNLEKYHKQNPSEKGMKRNAMQQSLELSSLKSREYNALLSVLNNVTIDGEIIRKSDFSPSFDEEITTTAQKISKLLDEYDFAPPKLDEIVQTLDEKNTKNVYFLLIKSGGLVKIAEDIVITQKQHEKLIYLLERFFEKNKCLTLPNAKDVLQTSRKYLVAFLEHLDKIGYTRRVPEGRMKR